LIRKRDSYPSRGSVKGGQTIDFGPKNQTAKEGKILGQKEVGAGKRTWKNGKKNMCEVSSGLQKKKTAKKVVKKL